MTKVEGLTKQSGTVSGPAPTAGARDWSSHPAGEPVNGLALDGVRGIRSGWRLLRTEAHRGGA
jgi:hypothetical protein